MSARLLLDLTSFASLYISLLVPLRPAEINLESQIQKVIAPLSDTAAITTVYNLLPQEPAFASQRLSLLLKLVSSTRHSKNQPLAIDHLVQSGLLTADTAETVASTLLEDDPDQALAFISRLPASTVSEKLQRSAFRLALAKPTSFRFASAASSLPEWSLVTAIFEQGAPLDDKLLKVEGLPELSRTALEVKQRSLALAGALARGGEKVPYSEVRKILDASADEEALEGAVIDGERSTRLFSWAFVALLTPAPPSFLILSHQGQVAHSSSQQPQARDQRDFHCPICCHSLCIRSW